MHDPNTHMKHWHGKVIQIVGEMNDSQASRLAYLLNLSAIVAINEDTDRVPYEVKMFVIALKTLGISF